jgi:hypothetical protein
MQMNTAEALAQLDHLLLPPPQRKSAEAQPADTQLCSSDVHRHATEGALQCNNQQQTAKLDSCQIISSHVQV